MDMTTSPLWVLTGERGIGKTTHCRTLVEQARAAGWDVAGLLSPAIFENGVKTGILAQDLRTSESRPFASLSTFVPQSTTFTLSLGQWVFDPTVVDWGNQVLQSRQPCDLFIVDELGPLEFFRGEGWVNAFDALRQVSYRLGVVVIRPECIDAFAKMGFSFQVAEAGSSQPSLLTSYRAQAKS
jgi:nucleoside-triphosphatase THEP1